MEILLLIGLLLVLGAAVCGILALIFKIFKKERKKTVFSRLALWLLIGGIVLTIIWMLVQDTSSALMLLAIGFILIAFVLLIIAVVRAILKKKKWKFFTSAGVCAALCIGCIVLSNVSWNSALNDRINYEVKIKTDFDFEVVDGDTPIEVTTSDGFDDLRSSTYRLVYDETDYYLVLENANPTPEECIGQINRNNQLSPKYKEFFTDFVTRIATIYPNANLAVLYKNLATLKVIELDKMDYLTKSLSLDSLGCYFKNENIIYIPEGTVYLEGEFGFQVLLHEFCHAARNSWWEDDNGIRYRIEDSSGNDTTLLCEALNSAFSCSLLKYYEWDIAYQVPSNYLRIMLECMDNYNLVDYMKHSEAYFLSKLDEYTGYTNYASVIWKLISVQRSDWERTDTDIPAEEYRPIYKYLCDMYYEKYITADMSKEERYKVADDLVYKAFYDAPEDYKIDEEFFYDYLESYIVK